METLPNITHKILEAAKKVGYRSHEGVAGTFFQIDHKVVASKINEMFKGKLEVLDTRDAIKKYRWVSKLLWKFVDKDKDTFTRSVYSAEKSNWENVAGYFIRILPNSEVTFPIQSCIVLAKQDSTQRVHNIIVAEKGSRANIITGCTIHPDITSGQHLGISEFLIKENASLNFTMIHNWASNTDVKPRSAAIIEENGRFVSNYICTSPVKDLQMHPKITCKGKNSSTRISSIIYAQKGSRIDIGSGVELFGENSSAEIISRTIAKENSQVMVKGSIHGKGKNSRGYLECKGILLDDTSFIHAIPELIGSRSDIDLSHEAAVGKINEDAIIYLMTRGLNEEEARSLLISGFLDVDILGLPENLATEIKQYIKKTAKAY